MGMDTAFTLSRLPGFRRAMPISGMQVTALRIVAGLYLVGVGVATLSAGPLLAILLALAGLWLASGVVRPAAAVVAWIVWSLIFMRGPTPAPWLPGVGLVLLLLALIPVGEGLVIGKRLVPERSFRYPATLYGLAWTFFALTLAFNVLLAWNNPVWRDGSAVGLMLDGQTGIEAWLKTGPLRFQHATLTYFTVLLQALAVLLSVARPGRFLAWVVLWPLFIVTMILRDSPDGGWGLVLILLALFDPQWLPGPKQGAGRHVVLYDGFCGMCNRAVQQLLADDYEKILSFTALQSDEGQALLREHGLPADLDSMVFVRQLGDAPARAYIRSDALLQIGQDIGGFWQALSWLRVIPAPLRNWLYDRMAANRYQVFGRYDTCPMPSKEDRARFLS